MDKDILIKLIHNFFDNQIEEYTRIEKDRLKMSTVRVIFNKIDYLKYKDRYEKLLLSVITFESKLPTKYRQKFLRYDQSANRDEEAVIDKMVIDLFMGYIELFKIILENISKIMGLLYNKRSKKPYDEYELQNLITDVHSYTLELNITSKNLISFLK